MSPALRVPDGTRYVYVRVDGLGAGETLQYTTDWSADDANNANQIDANSWRPLSGGAFDGSNPGTPKPGTDPFFVNVACPAEARWIRASYLVTTGSASFGVSGEFRPGETG